MVVDREVDRIYRSSDGEGVGVAATNSSATSDIVRVSSVARRGLLAVRQSDKPIPQM